MVTSGYCQVIPNSHMWSNIAMLLQWLKYQKEGCGMSTIEDRQKFIEYLEIGLNNSLKEGYDIRHEETMPIQKPCGPVYYRDITYAAQTAPPPPIPPADRIIREGHKPTPPPTKMLREGEYPNFNRRNY